MAVLLGVKLGTDFRNTKARKYVDILAREKNGKKQKIFIPDEVPELPGTPGSRRPIVTELVTERGVDGATFFTLLSLRVSMEIIPSG